MIGPRPADAGDTVAPAEYQPGAFFWLPTPLTEASFPLGRQSGALFAGGLRQSGRELEPDKICFLVTRSMSFLPCLVEPLRALLSPAQ